MGMAGEPELFHVLAVDDSLIDRKLIERLLKTSSFLVTTVDSGSKALEFLGLHQDVVHNNSRNLHQPSISPSPRSQQGVEVNLIITDYCMPGMTGYDLLKKVKESTTFRDIPVIIMSSENVPSRITRCLEEGAEEFFLKPVRLSDVNKLRPHLLRAKKYGQQKQGCQKPEQKQQQPLQQSEFEQQKTEQNNTNKRKSLDEGLSPDRTRPRYNNGLTTVA